jgi:hypothetical protein
MALIADWLLAQRIPLDTGFHWDGTYYIDYVRNIGKLADGSIDRYSYTRVLPSVLVHGWLRITGQGFDDRSILYGFVVLNAVMALCSLFAWSAIARVLSMSVWQLHFGAVALLINFCFLKYNSFYPIITDVTAFALSMGMIWAYLVRAPAGVAAGAALGAFTWPTLLLMGCLLLVLPRWRNDADPGRLASAINTSGPRHRWPQLMAAATGLAVMAALAYVHWGLAYRHSGAPTMEAFAWLSVLIVGGYVTLAVAPLLAGWSDVLRIWDDRARYLLGLALALVLYVSVQALIAGLAKPGARNSLSDFLLGTIATSMKSPGVFLIAHFVFFGPVIALAMLSWSRVCEIARELGPGFAASLALCLALGLGAESRQLMPNIAFVVIPTVAACAGGRRPWLSLGVVIAVSLALSRVWVVLDVSALVFKVDEYLKYPWQHFFGAVGYWMTPGLYVAHLLALVTTLALLLALGLVPGQRLAKRPATRPASKTPNGTT